MDSGAKQASAVDRRYCHMEQWVDSVDRRHCHMGQCVDPLAMLPGRWGLVRTMEIRCGRASEGSKLMVLGDSTKAVVGWITAVVTSFDTTIYIGGAVRFSLSKNGFQLNR